MSPDRLRLIAVLAVSQIVGWGTTFDMPGVLGRTIAGDLDLANEVAFAGLTVMMVTGGLLGPLTGRLLSRHGAARVLASGSVSFALGLALLALAAGPILYFAAWGLLGIGAAFGLSVPCYAAVVEREGQDAKRTIALLMIFTGLSAAIFWPIWSALDGIIGWRNAALLAAALQFFVLAPLHLFALPKVVAHDDTKRAAAAIEPLALTPAMAMTAIVLIGLVSAAFNLVGVGIGTQLIPFLQSAGATPALALQLGSLRSVFGISARAVDLVTGKRGSALLSGTIAAGLILVSLPLLWFSGGNPVLLLAFVACYGFGSGIAAVTRALLPLSFVSPARYARVSANLSLTSNLAMATAPVITTAVLDRAGTHGLITYCGLLAAFTLAGLVWLGLIARRGRLAPSPALQRGGF
ncbi:MFS transporter [Rhizobium halophytocola]|uniref:MFS family arabinose efflux permease n=1 Tax=Rhizobium halophytocola TaxID=735519 RepID=A0ABS4DYY7_9HYPH|nr:MFS transporter [Rhizobium halophytocola]MBP1850906.1 putative MFS family arabinose efflux permease [Rhizobium halophytocola]